MVFRIMGFVVFGAIALLSPAWTSAAANQSFPVEFTLDREAQVTVVIDDQGGKRVRNLVAATRLPAGKHVLSWDGYDDGIVQKDGSTVRSRVSPGTYRARGITSDGLRLIYEFPVNSPGTPPWFTKERDGAWLADHTSGQAVVFVPASDSGFMGRGQARVIVAAKTAECGDAFMALDLEGKKLLGTNDFGWDGGYALAIDCGPNAMAGENEPWLYSLIFGGKTLSINAYTRSGKAIRPFKHEVANDYKWTGGRSGDSIAAWNGYIVISVPQDNALLVADLRAKPSRFVGSIKFEDPRGLLFDSQGRLLVAGPKQVKRLTLDLPNATVTKEELFIAGDLEDAQQLAQDSAGNTYVGQWGTKHNINVFSPEGKLIRSIGKAGEPQLGGQFDNTQMHYPKGLAVDDKDQLWVVDCDIQPKRVSLWSSKEGALRGTFIGGPAYGGGGALDPLDKTKMYYGIFNGGYTLKLDWEKGNAVVDSVFTRPEQFKGLDRDRHVGMIPDNAFHIGEHTFLIANFTSSLAANNSAGMIWHKGNDGVAWPVALVGALNLQEPSHGLWNPARNPGVKEFFENPGDGKKLDFKAMVIWSDLNRDGRAQTEEFKYWRTDTAYFGNNIRFNDDLSFTVRGHSFPAPTITENGVPVWSEDAKLTPLTGADRPHNTVSTADQWALHVGRDHRGQVPNRHNAILGYRDGQLNWEYPSLNGTFIPTDPGTVIMAQRFLGAPFAPKVGEAGTIFGFTGERGSVYLMTADGLFLQDVSGDARTKPAIGQKYPKAERGMIVEGISFMDEHFGPTLQQTAEGDVILIAGKEFSAIFRVDGLQNVRRQDFATLGIAAAQLEKLPETIVLPARIQGSLTHVVGVGGTAPTVDGDLSDWESELAWANLDDRASARLRIVGDRLYAAWRTNDPNALANAPGEPKFAFKRGGAVDLMIATDPKADPKRVAPVAGDIRLLATMQAGKPLGVLYRAVVPGTAEADRVPFISPVGRVDFDRVDDVSDQLQLAQRGGDIELSIPLATLGLTESSIGTILQGDIGILRGTGAMTMQRLYWNNLDTGIASDVPSEAKLTPSNWGRWVLGRERRHDDGGITLPADKATFGEKSLILKTYPGGEVAIASWKDAADQIVWKDIPVKPGTYDVDLAVACGNRRQNDFVLEVGGQLLEGKAPFTGAWEAFVPMHVGRVTITEGPATFTLKAKSVVDGLMNVQHLVLTPVR